MDEKRGNYEVEILERQGTLEKPLFEKLAKNGDIISTKATDILEQKISIQGIASCKITAGDKVFVMYYYDTKEYGIISSGSQYLYASILDYHTDCEFMKIIEVKTKKGKTYKAVPIFDEKNNQDEEDDLPF